MKNKGFKTLNEVKREHIIKVLDATKWNIKKASAILNVTESFLRKEIRQLEEPIVHNYPKKKTTNNPD
ncbi:MAG TPA: helix-turn-helix domain-containing protein [Syntrophorhabdaceae bacterium]|nr:helix-turn-helix domain-containing protein [Syntrophorhabdaceae bacterium]HPU29112.1 helix-turn-helix domain-containing protein [Syntrophorhabdaceae bacterium]